MELVPSVGLDNSAWLGLDEDCGAPWYIANHEVAILYGEKSAGKDKMVAAIGLDPCHYCPPTYFKTK